MRSDLRAHNSVHAHSGLRALSAVTMIFVVSSLVPSCYSDRIPERRVRVEPGSGGNGLGGEGTGGDGMGGDSGDGDVGTGGMDGTGGATTEPGCVLRVDVSVSAALPDGLSWATAFSHPSLALAHMETEALEDCDLWIAEGTYVVAAPGLDVQSARLLGGFDGDEATEGERNVEARPVLLDAEGANITVLTLTDAAIDGIGVKGGSLGILVEAGANQLEGVDVFDNAPGGGIRVDDGSLTLTHSRVFQNQVVDTSGGGGLLGKSGTNVTIEDSLFANNSTSGTSGVRQGGGIHLFGATMIVRRSLFVGNTSNTKGGAASFGAADFRVEDCVFIGNTAPTGAAIQADVSGEIVNVTCTNNEGGATINGSSTVLNTILWDNDVNLPTGAGEPDVLVSVVEGDYSGGNSQDVITDDPLLEGDLFTATTTTRSLAARTTQLGHDASATQGSLEGLFAEVTTGPLAGFYFIVDNPSGALELLGRWGTDLESQSVRVIDLHLTAASPAIDRAWGTTPQYDVSDADVEGDPRRDVASVTDQGLGTPTFVDVGAFER